MGTTRVTAIVKSIKSPSEVFHLSNVKKLNKPKSTKNFKKRHGPIYFLGLKFFESTAFKD